MIDCIPNAAGKRCIHCGWKWKLHPRPWPRRNCPAQQTPEAKAARKAEIAEANKPENIVARMLKEINNLIQMGLMAGWPDGGKEAVEARLAVCEKCESLSQGGCADTMFKCQRWEAWRKVLLAGECDGFDAE